MLIQLQIKKLHIFLILNSLKKIKSIDLCYKIKLQLVLWMIKNLHLICKKLQELENNLN